MIRRFVCAIICMLIGFTMRAQNYTVKGDVIIFSDTVMSENTSYEAARDFFIRENLYRDVAVIYDSDNHIAGVTTHYYLPFYEYAQYSRVVIDVAITGTRYTIKVMAAKRYCQRNMSRAGGYVDHFNMCESEPIDKKSRDSGDAVGNEVFKAYQKLCAEIIGHFRMAVQD